MRQSQRLLGPLINGSYQQADKLHLLQDPSANGHNGHKFSPNPQNMSTSLPKDY